MFRDFFALLEQTGCRPFSEAARIAAGMIDRGEGRITFTRHKNARTGKSRVVCLTDKAVEVLRRRGEGKGPDVLVFHTRNGFAFTGPNTVQRIRRLERVCRRERFGQYAIRHSYIVEALERGTSSDIIAELVGTRRRRSPATTTTPTRSGTQ